MRYRFVGCLITSLVILVAFNAAPFSLLGPLAPWMTQEIGYGREGDVGGPMDIGKEYRWNIPIITYGFDQEFVDYFGEAGVRAVEDAIAIITNRVLSTATNPVFESTVLGIVGAVYDIEGTQT